MVVEILAMAVLKDRALSETLYSRKDDGNAHSSCTALRIRTAGNDRGERHPEETAIAVTFNTACIAMMATPQDLRTSPLALA